MDIKLEPLSETRLKEIHNEAVIYAKTPSEIKKCWNDGHPNNSKPSTMNGALAACSDLIKLPIFQVLYYSNSCFK